jgi:hypothetical protein
MAISKLPEIAEMTTFVEWQLRELQKALSGRPSTPLQSPQIMRDPTDAAIAPTQISTQKWTR